MNGHRIENSRLLVELPKNETNFCSFCGKKGHLFYNNIFEKLKPCVLEPKIAIREGISRKKIQVQKKSKNNSKHFFEIFFRFIRRSRSRSRSKSFK